MTRIIDVVAQFCRIVAVLLPRRARMTRIIDVVAKFCRIVAVLLPRRARMKQIVDVVTQLCWNGRNANVFLSLLLEIHNGGEGHTGAGNRVAENDFASV